MSEIRNHSNCVGGNSVVIKAPVENALIRIKKWLVKEGFPVIFSQEILLYEVLADENSVEDITASNTVTYKLKAQQVGVVMKRFYKDGATVRSDLPLLELSECIRTTAMKDMSIDCCADLHKTENGSSSPATIKAAFNFGDIANQMQKIVFNSTESAEDGLNFGSSSSNTTKPAFNFGVNATQQKPILNFTGRTQSQNSTKPFQFGATPSAPASNLISDKSQQQKKKKDKIQKTKKNKNEIKKIKKKIFNNKLKKIINTKTSLFNVINECTSLKYEQVNNDKEYSVTYTLEEKQFTSSNKKVKIAKEQAARKLLKFMSETEHADLNYEKVISYLFSEFLKN